MTLPASDPRSSTVCFPSTSSSPKKTSSSEKCMVSPQTLISYYYMFYYRNERISDHMVCGRSSWAMRTREEAGVVVSVLMVCSSVSLLTQMRMATRMARRAGGRDSGGIAVDEGSEGAEVAGGEGGGGVGEEVADRGGAVADDGALQGVLPLLVVANSASGYSRTKSSKTAVSLW